VPVTTDVLGGMWGQSVRERDFVKAVRSIDVDVLTLGEP
jgi:hypothetical protein